MESCPLRTVNGCRLPWEHKPPGGQTSFLCAAPGCPCVGLTEDGQPSEKERCLAQPQGRRSLRRRAQEGARGLGLSVHAKWGSLEAAAMERPEAWRSYVQS